MERVELNTTLLTIVLQPHSVAPQHDLAYGWGETLELGPIEDPVSLSIFPQTHALKLRSMTDFLHFSKIDCAVVEEGVVRFHGDMDGITRSLLVMQNGNYMMLRETAGSTQTFGGERERRAGTKEQLRVMVGDPNYRERSGIVTAIEQMFDRNQKPFWKVTVDGKNSFRVFDNKMMETLKPTDVVDYVERRTHLGYWNLARIDRLTYFPSSKVI